MVENEIERLRPEACTVGEKEKERQMTMIDETAQVDLPKLFTVTSAGNVNGFHNVKISWFANRDRTEDVWPDLPWTAMISGPDGGYTKYAIQEFFTAAEAMALVEYLKRIDPDPEAAPVMELVRLPVDNCLVSFTDWVETGDDHGMVFPLDSKGDSELPLKVSGYCNLNGRLAVIERDGGFVVGAQREGFTVSISRPFSNRGAAEEWMRHVLPDIHR
jgi:hypothetical protein